jgi:tetratricopeptide (TPR) repeat protein
LAFIELGLNAGGVPDGLANGLPRAERYFRKYLTMEPEGGEPHHAAAHWRLGLVLEKEGKNAEAIGEMEEALRAEPDFKEAKADLKRLRK